MKKTSPLRLYVLALIAALSLFNFRCHADEPDLEPGPKDLSRIASWDEVETSICRTFHVDCTGLIFGVLDALYVLPSQDALNRVEKFRQRYMDGGPFVDEAKDCDDFAREATYLAKRWSYRYFEDLPATLAFGSAFVRIDGEYSLFSQGRHQWMRGYHVLNVYLRNDGKWFFFEPQTGQSEPVESMIYEGVVTVIRVEI